jgi:hypothetical protein
MASVITILVGGVITTGIDYLLGVSFTEISFVVQVAHKTMYMLFGVAIFRAGNRY